MGSPGENRFPAGTYLNRFKPEDYTQTFAGHLDMVSFEGRDANHDRGGLEGERFLTPELAKELAEYPRELRLTRSWCIICRKPQS